MEAIDEFLASLSTSVNHNMLSSIGMVLLLVVLVLIRCCCCCCCDEKVGYAMLMQDTLHLKLNGNQASYLPAGCVLTRDTFCPSTSQEDIKLEWTTWPWMTKFKLFTDG